MDFQIADPGELEVVDTNLQRLAANQRLDLRAIEDFIGQCDALRTAVSYYDAFAQYFYGVLARERSPESDLKPEEYRGKYDLAASVLAQFERLPARTVSALVAFHFNQFDRALTSGFDSPRLFGATERMRRFITSGSRSAVDLVPADHGFDEIFADAETERVLRWVSQPFTEESSRALETAATYVLDCEPYDQVKLRVVLGEYYFHLGEPEAARQHVESLLHNELTEKWARSLRARL